LSSVHFRESSVSDVFMSAAIVSAVQFDSRPPLCYAGRGPSPGQALRRSNPGSSIEADNPVEGSWPQGGEPSLNRPPVSNRPSACWLRRLLGASLAVRTLWRSTTSCSGEQATQRSQALAKPCGRSGTPAFARASITTVGTVGGHGRWCARYPAGFAGMRYRGPSCTVRWLQPAAGKSLNVGPGLVVLQWLLDQGGIGGRGEGWAQGSAKVLRRDLG